jgi:nucleolar protein 9
MFFAAALAEMQGKEHQLATDPDCAVILERMIHSMDDLARRIFANSLLGSYVHTPVSRFHLCLTHIQHCAASKAPVWISCFGDAVGIWCADC